MSAKPVRDNALKRPMRASESDARAREGKLINIRASAHDESPERERKEARNRARSKCFIMSS